MSDQTAQIPEDQLIPKDVALRILAGWLDSISKEKSGDYRLVFERRGFMPNGQGVVVAVRAESMVAVLPLEFSKIVQSPSPIITAQH